MNSLSRIENATKVKDGWYVRVYYCGKTYACFFKDDKYDSSEQARLVGICWRNVKEVIGNFLIVVGIILLFFGRWWTLGGLALIVVGYCVEGEE